jgi:hypothetical protein
VQRSVVEFVLVAKEKKKDFPLKRKKNVLTEIRITVSRNLSAKSPDIGGVKSRNESKGISFIK